GRFEVLTVSAITHVELIPDNREPHRMRAEEQLTVFDRVRPEVRWDVRRPAAVPARPMACFRLVHATWLAAARTRVEARHPRRRRNLPYVWRRDPVLPSARASAGTR